MTSSIRPEALNCPNCGGAVMSDAIRCEFCSSRLKTVGCSKCLGVMFMGSSFCTHCGARAVAVTSAAESFGGECPRCRVPLEALEMEDVSINQCVRCSGLWVGKGTFESICSDQERQAAVLGFVRQKADTSEPQKAINYVPCPECRELMNRSNFARSSGVIIDLCREHGVWFDVEELPRIIEFINKGGLSLAREKERAAILEERRRLRDEQRRAASSEHRSGRSKFGRGENGTFGESVIRFLFE